METNSENSTIAKEIQDYQSFKISDTNLDALGFFRNNKKRFPILAIIVRRIFCAQAASVPSERLFSAAGYHVWDRGNKISTQKVNKILIVHQYDLNHERFNENQLKSKKI